MGLISWATGKDNFDTSQEHQWRHIMSTWVYYYEGNFTAAEKKAVYNNEDPRIWAWFYRQGAMNLLDLWPWQIYDHWQINYKPKGIRSPFMESFEPNYSRYIRSNKRADVEPVWTTAQKEKDIGLGWVPFIDYRWKPGIDWAYQFSTIGKTLGAAVLGFITGGPIGAFTGYVAAGVALQEKAEAERDAARAQIAADVDAEQTRVNAATAAAADPLGIGAAFGGNNNMLLLLGAAVVAFFVLKKKSKK